MILNDNIKPKGSFSFIIYNENMDIKHQDDGKNLIVDVGKEWVAKYLSGESPDNLSFMALGSGNSAPVDGDIGLGNELGRAAFDSIVRVGNSIQYIATFLPGIATGSIVEAGLFNADIGGEMLSRRLFTLATKDPTDTMVGVWDITVT